MAAPHKKTNTPVQSFFAPDCADFPCVTKVALQKICLSGTKKLLPVALREKARWESQRAFSLFSYVALPLRAALLYLIKRHIAMPMVPYSICLYNLLGVLVTIDKKHDALSTNVTMRKFFTFVYFVCYNHFRKIKIKYEIYTRRKVMK